MDQKTKDTHDRAIGLTHAAVSDLDMQYEALEALCESYNSRVTLSSMRFYPKGGSLYRFFWTRDQLNQHGRVVDPMPECYETGDVDGLLLVVPRGITNVRMLDYVKSTVVQNEDEEYVYSHIDLKKDIYDIAEEAYAKVLNKRDAAAWLKNASSTKKYSLSLRKETFVPLTRETEKTAVSTFEFFPVFDTTLFSPGWDVSMTTENMYLDMTYRGKSENLDVHFGFLEPSAKNEDSMRAMDIILNATPVSSSVYIMPKKQFFVDQLRLMFERVNKYFHYAVFDDEIDVKKKHLTKALSGRVFNAVNTTQSVLKAGKTLCRIKEFSSFFEHLTLQDLFEWRQGLPLNNKRYLQSTLLKEYVGKFNTLMFGEQLLDGTMTVGRVVKIVDHIFVNTKHIGTASIEMSRRKTMFAECLQKTLQYKQLLCADMRF